MQDNAAVAAYLHCICCNALHACQPANVSVESMSAQDVVDGEAKADEGLPNAVAHRVPLPLYLLPHALGPVRQAIQKVLERIL